MESASVGLVLEDSSKVQQPLALLLHHGRKWLRPPHNSLSNPSLLNSSKHGQRMSELA